MKKSTIQKTQPLPNQAEISIFGPGIGECIVLHYGNGNWLIVDSCLCPQSKRPIALVYLESLGVNVKSQVRRLLITHWDSDHIKGALNIIEQCPSAKIHFPAALLEPEAFTFARAYGKNCFADMNEEVKEFYEIVLLIMREEINHRLKPISASNLLASIEELSCRLVALSPSAEAVNQSIANLVELKPSQGSRRTRAKVKQTRNLNSVALYFEFNGCSTLLGSDLEETANDSDLTGWSAIINSGIIDDLEIKPSKIFKVPHHGSKTGHYPPIVDKLLSKNPISATTPNITHNLPKEEDIKRIIDYSKIFWVTTTKGGKIKRPKVVKEMMKSNAIDWYTINQKMGHIQIRFSKDSNINLKSNELCVSYS